MSTFNSTMVFLKQRYLRVAREDAARGSMTDSKRALTGYDSIITLQKRRQMEAMIERQSTKQQKV